LWIVAGIVIVGGLVAVAVVVMRGRERAQALGQVERLRLLGDALSDYADEHEGALPAQVPADVSATDRAGRHLGREALLTDAATGQPIVYRIVTESGERLRRDAIGERLIAWSPQASYRGMRAILLNDFTAGLVADSAIDLSQQRLLLSDPLNKVAPTAAEGVDEGEGEAEETPTTEPSDEPATGPATRP
jgi:hypothetical protein